MADLLDKKTGAKTKIPAPPDKQRLDLRPELRKPPKIQRWIQWMAMFVVAAVAAVLAAVFLTGGDEGLTAQPYDRGAEHGEYTVVAARDLTNADIPRFAGLDAGLAVVYPERYMEVTGRSDVGEFTTMAVRTVANSDLQRFAGMEANLYPRWVEHGQFTTMEVRDLTSLDLPRFAGSDAAFN